MGTTKSKGISRKVFLQQLGLGIGALGTGLFFSESLSAAGFITEKTNNPKQVLVLGAGLAGLSAAWELKKAGHEVTVLEARNRPGGRVSTLHKEFADGLYAEEGAAAFSESYTHALRFIEEFKLEKIPLLLPEEPVTFHLNGKRINAVPGEKVDWPYELSDEEQQLGPMGLVKKYIIDTLPTESTEPQQWDKAPLVKMDQVSLEEYLREQGASEGAIKLIANTQWFAALPAETSGLSTAVSDFGLFMSSSPFILKGGNDQLPAEMAKRMNGNIQFGLEVNSIQDSGEEVVVTATNGAGDAVKFKGDEVIVAFPLKVLEKIKFEPDLPAAKTMAVQNMPVIDLTRTFLQMKEPYWKKEGVTGMAYTDLPIGQVNPYLNAKDAENNPAILEGYVAGEQAEKLGNLPEEEVIKEMKSHMEKVHPGVEEHFVKGYVKAWSADPYALGGPSWPAPGNVTSYLKDLQASHGRLHFAGEYTSILRSTMEGALRSGARVAKQIHEKS